MKPFNTILLGIYLSPSANDLTLFLKFYARDLLYRFCSLVPPGLPPSLIDFCRSIPETEVSFPFFAEILEIVTPSDFLFQMKSSTSPLLKAPIGGTSLYSDKGKAVTVVSLTPTILPVRERSLFFFPAPRYGI